MTEELVKQVDSKQWVLTAIDRCDYCGAQAYVRVTGVTGSLDFCGHHYNRHQVKLDSFGFEIIDEREKLVTNRLLEE